MSIQIAKPTDIPELVTLINSAYRGDASKKGWTTEADLVDGDIRTDADNLDEFMQAEGTLFLVYKNDDRGEIEGSVLLQRNHHRMYLGMLTVAPMNQGAGIGNQLMKASEEYAREWCCESIYMRVISLRHELISWYEKKGFTNSGVTEPFPKDTRFGAPTRPLEFLILEKKM